MFIIGTKGKQVAANARADFCAVAAILFWLYMKRAVRLNCSHSISKIILPSGRASKCTLTLDKLDRAAQFLRPSRTIQRKKNPHTGYDQN